MDDKVVNFTGTTTLDFPAETLRDNIDWAQLESVLMMAVDKSGLVHIYANKSDVDPMLALIEKVKFDILSGAYSN